MKTKILLFSTLRERLGFSEKEFFLDEPRAAAVIFCELFKDSQEARDWLRSIRFAINGEYVAAEAIVQPGSELAVIPPVSGG